MDGHGCYDNTDDTVRLKITKLREDSCLRPGTSSSIYKYLLELLLQVADSDRPSSGLSWREPQKVHRGASRDSSRTFATSSVCCRRAHDWRGSATSATHLFLFIVLMVPRFKKALQRTERGVDMSWVGVRVCWCWVVLR